MSVVLQVRGDESVIRYGVVRNIFREARERHVVQLLAGSTGVGKVDQRVVTASVVLPLKPGVTGVRQVFLIALPCHPMQQKMADNIIDVETFNSVAILCYRLAGDD